MENNVCTHLDRIREVEPRTPDGCEECLRTGDRWVHLRLCLTCGHVGCCDSSPNRHATKHFRATEHPIVRSFEPGEDWRWWYLDRVRIEGPAGVPSLAGRWAAGRVPAPSATAGMRRSMRAGPLSFRA